MMGGGMDAARIGSLTGVFLEDGKYGREGERADVRRRLLQRAVAEDPYNAEVRALYAQHLGSIHHPDAPGASLTAYRLDPLNWSAVSDYATSLLVLGRQKDSLSVWESFLATQHTNATSVGKVDALLGLGRIESADLELEQLVDKLGASHPSVLDLQMRIALRRRDYETAAGIESDLIRRSENEYILLSEASPQRLEQRLGIAIAQRDPQVIFRLLSARPGQISSEHWARFQTLAKTSDIRSPIVRNYRARDAGEIATLLSRESPIDGQVLINLSGRYVAEGFRELEFVTDGARLELNLSGVDLRIVHTGDLRFELLPVRGYHYQFDGQGSLSATNGQLERSYRKADVPD
jgi:hypothetical protein